MVKVMVFATLAVVFLAADVTLASDGEGTATIEPTGDLIAGSNVTITVTYTVGPSGIPVGGGVMLAVHHASYWPGLQIDAPNQPGHMTVTCETPDNFELEWYPWWAPKGTFLKRTPQDGKAARDPLFHRSLFAKVKREALEPGEEVRFVLGANGHGTTVQPYVDKNHEFRVMTDADGDGAYASIRSFPVFDIVPNVAHHLVGSVPAVVVAGEPFEMQIRAEDEFFNCATGYAGEVTVRDEDGSVLAENVSVSGGLTRIELTLADAGPRRIRLDDGTLEGRSNPFRVCEEAPEYRIYWGDIHGHTTISDGLGDNAYDYFEFGRDVADLDVCALTDHGMYDWPKTIDAVKKFYEPGKYVTILGMEGGAKFGHMNLYYRSDDEEHISTWPATYEAFLKHVAEQYGTEGRVITGPHHFSAADGKGDYPFGIFDERIERFVEIYSAHGTSEYRGNPRPLGKPETDLSFTQTALAKGLRFGIIASRDNHDSHPGRPAWGAYKGGLVAFLAKELTREAVWDAFWNRRVYATSYDRVYVEFTVNDRVMGSDFAVDAPCSIDYYVIGQADNVDVFLIRNNEEIRKDSADNGVVEVSFEDDPPAGENFYYLRVVQDNGERAWSTPIWIARE